MRTHSVALRLQKNLAGKLAHRGFVRRIMPDGTLDALDHFYDVLIYYYPANEAEKMISNVMKIVAKLGIMLQDSKIVDDNMAALMEMQESLRSLFRTVQSFHQLEHSYSAPYLFERIAEAQQALLTVAASLLSPKSQVRISFVFERLANRTLLDEFFKINGKHDASREKFIDAIDLIVP